MNRENIKHMMGENTLLAGIILSLITWAYFYGISIIIRQLLPDELKESLAKTLQAKYLIWVGVGIFIISFGLRERFIFFWDYAGYWGTSISYMDHWFKDIQGSLNQLYTSILNDEYNLLPTILLLLPLKLIGITFPAYALSIYLMYIVPFYAITISLIVRIAYDCGKPLSAKMMIACMACMCFISPILEPVLTGYLDAAGLPICISILAIVYLKERQQIKSVPALIGLTILLIILVFTRRWFAYWIVSFFVSYGSILIYRLFSKENRTTSIRSLIDITIVGVCCVAVLFIGFRQFLIRSVLTNYGDVYSAYQKASFIGDIKLIIHHIGIWLILLALIGCIEAIRMSNRWFFIMVLIQSILTLILFINVQSMSTQHYYLIISGLTIFTLLGVVTLANVIKKSIMRKTVVVLVLVITFGGFMRSFVPQAWPLVNKFSWMYSADQFYPRVRNDVDKIRLLGSYLNERSGIDPSSNVQNVYVLASSIIMNDDIIRKVNLPYKLNSVPPLILSYHVDKRDGFPKQLLQADIVVVGDPIQYHLRDTDQRVVGVLAEQFLKNEGIGKSFRLDKTFTLDNNVKAKVYIKEKPLNNEDLKALQTQFQAWYPDFADKFKIVDTQ